MKSFLRSTFVLAVAAVAGCSSSETTAPSRETAAAGVAEKAPEAAASAAAENPVEKPAPDFTALDVDGNRRSLAEFRGKWVVLEWTNHGCPFVKKHYATGNMQKLQAKYTAKGVAWLSICSSAKGKEGWMTPDGWKAKLAAVGSAATATLLDADGAVGRAYGAKNTPTMLVIDPRGGIVYRGAIDDKRSADPKDVATARNYVAETLDAVLDGRPAPVAETAPYG